MIRFCANIDWLFTEFPFLDRFQAAKDCGFAAIETLFPYDHALEGLIRAKERAGIGVALINMPAGDRAAGELGWAAVAGGEARFAADLDRAFDYAVALKAERLHVLAGMTATPDAAVFRANLAQAAARAARHGMGVTIEPLNSRDRPGYALSMTNDAIGHIDAVGAPNLKLQFDSYHVTIMEGDAVARFKALAPRVGHIQVSHLDGRGPPGPGAIDFSELFAAIEASGYAGWIGCEYKPPGPTRASLGWGREFGLG